MAPRRLAQLRALGVCLVVAAAVSVPRPALAQDRTPKPSAENLWEQYPLDRGEPGPTRSAAPSPAPRAARASRTPDAGGSGGETIAAMLIILSVVAAAAGAVLVLRRHRSRPRAAGMPVPAVPRLGLAGPLMTGNGVQFTPSVPGRRRSQVPGSKARGDVTQHGEGVRPPDPTRRWTAEIRWQHSGEESRFCVAARDRRAGRGTVIARSEPLDWPPADPDAVQALVSAADALTEALVSAGWKPLPRGTAWFERRFEWEAVVTSSGWAPPVPTPAARPAGPKPGPQPPAPSAGPSGRFRKKPWPPDTETLWRCEIKWSPGYVRSRFEAVAHNPERRNDRVIVSSPPFKWLLMGDPDPSDPAFRRELRSLVVALESAGWQRLDPGADWYSERFVWRGEGEPMDELVPATPKAHRTP